MKLSILALVFLGCAPLVDNSLPPTILPPSGELLTDRLAACGELWDHIVYMVARDEVEGQLPTMTSQEFLDHKQAVRDDLSEQKLNVKFFGTCVAQMNYDSIQCAINANTKRAVNDCSGQ